jgi:hypothetical protein
MLSTTTYEDQDTYTTMEETNPQHPFSFGTPARSTSQRANFPSWLRKFVESSLALRYFGYTTLVVPFALLIVIGAASVTGVARPNVTPFSVIITTGAKTSSNDISPQAD